MSNIEEILIKLSEANNIKGPSFKDTLKEAVLFLAQNDYYSIMSELLLLQNEYLLVPFTSRKTGKTEPGMPSNVYAMLLMGIIYYFSDPKNRMEDPDFNNNLIAIQTLLKGLEGEAITGLIYLITKEDFENLQQGRRVNIYTARDFDIKNKIVNMAFIEVKQDDGSLYKKHCAIINDRTNKSIVNIINPVFPKSDIATNFVWYKSIYFISNTTVNDLLDSVLKSGGKRKTRSKQKSLKKRKTRTKHKSLKKSGGKRKTRTKQKSLKKRKLV